MHEQKDLEAIDALNKIAALTSAALYLHHGETGQCSLSDLPRWTK